MPAQSGDTVRVHYTGTLEDGTRFDSSEGREPLEFTLGDGEVIAGFEEAVQGMDPGDTRTVTLPADDAYGQRHDHMILELDRDQLPPEREPEVGDEVVLGTDEGHRIPALIVDVKEDTVVVDANHPLAGEDLTLEIELVDIQ
jgi:peptidylprolyl isomerase